MATTLPLAPLSIAALGLSLAIGLAAPAQLRAQDGARPEPTQAELDEARHSFELARRAFDAGDYDTAADEFRAAYELMRHPDLLFNLYLAEERAARHREAEAALRGYLEGATIAPEQRALLERRLARLQARIERADRAGSEVEADTAPEEDLALQDPIALGEPTASGTTTTTADTAAATTPADAAPSVGGGPPAVAIGLLIGGGVLLVSFAVLAALSEVEDQALAAECGRSAGLFCSAERVSTLEALNIAADVSWIAGATLAAVGLVLLFALPPEGGTAGAQVAVAPWASPDGLGLAAGGRF